MEKNVKYRYELKYLCSEAQIAIIRNRLQSLMPYDTHAESGQYTIRSIYFDNYANKCYYENESGTDPREKFRIRIYNASNKRISLECKRKERGKTHKTSCLLSLNDYESVLRGGCLHGLLDKPALLRKFTILQLNEMFHPVVIVEYDRTPFVYQTGNVRITLDRNIRSSVDFANFFQQNLAVRPILPTGQHLLEVKYDELVTGCIKDVLQLGNLRQTTFSKYYLCRKYTMGGQP